MVDMSTMLKVDEVAHILHVHPNTVRLWTNRGILKTFRLGPRGDRRFLWNDLVKFISTNGAELGLDLELLIDAGNSRPARNEPVVNHSNGWQ